MPRSTSPSSDSSMPPTRSSPSVAVLGEFLPFPIITSFLSFLRRDASTLPPPPLCRHLSPPPGHRKLTIPCFCARAAFLYAEFRGHALRERLRLSDLDHAVTWETDSGGAGLAAGRWSCPSAPRGLSSRYSVASLRKQSRKRWCDNDRRFLALQIGHPSE